MKKLLIMLLAVVAFGLTSCKDDDVKPKAGDKLYINGKDRANKGINGTALTAHEVCCYEKLVICLEHADGSVGGSFFSHERGNIDSINNRLIMDAIDIQKIEDNSFFDSEFVFIMTDDEQNDTIAYIPYQPRLEAKEQIKELWDKGEWKKITQIFQDSMYFIPCTAEEYKQYRYGN